MKCIVIDVIIMLNRKVIIITCILLFEMHHKILKILK